MKVSQSVCLCAGLLMMLGALTTRAADESPKPEEKKKAAPEAAKGKEKEKQKQDQPKKEADKGEKKNGEKPKGRPPIYGWETYPVLRVGFGRADITPEEHRTLIGFGYRDEGHKGVHDALLARVLLLRDSTNPPAVMVSLDLALLSLKEVRKLRHEISTDLETPTDRILICATHTHSAQYPSREHMAKDIRPSVMEAVRQAGALAFPVRAWIREAPLGIAYNRRVKMPDGKVRNCWGPQEWFPRQPENAPDPTCSVLVFRQQNGSRQYILWSVGAHPVGFGRVSRVVSGDYPGLACRMIEDYIPGARAIFALGPCGDTQPWVSTQEDPRQVKNLARCTASFVTLLTEAGRPVATKYPEFKTAAKTIELGRTELDLVLWRLGEVWIVGCPGELFQELGLDLRKRLGGPVIFATVASGGGTYLPTKKAFEEGGYEVGAARRAFGAGDGEKLMDEFVALADTIRSEEAEETDEEPKGEAKEDGTEEKSAKQ